MAVGENEDADTRTLGCDPIEVLALSGHGSPAWPPAYSLRASLIKEGTERSESEQMSCTVYPWALADFDSVVSRFGHDRCAPAEWECVDGWYNPLQRCWQPVMYKFGDIAWLKRDRWQHERLLHSREQEKNRRSSHKGSTLTPCP